MCNEDTLSTEPDLNNTPSETILQVCNNLNENTADLPFSEVKKTQKISQLGHFNVSSFRNKFISIEELINSKLVIFLASETKTDPNFPD